jgi:predicted Ser/Thr protein kinase
MISQSRFDDQLKAIGLLPRKPGVRSILNTKIMDPGGNLLKGFRPASRADQPLTVMAKSATAGNRGINVDGYRDYRGVPVIGAWIWLDEYDFGVTTELDVAEAFRALRILRYVFGLLFGLLLLATLGVLFSARIISALHIRVERLGQYTLERKLGKGGMGQVYLARHAMLRRPTALKILRPERTNEAALARFEREVQITSQLTHLNTIRIYDFGRTPSGTFYYAMEYLPGVNLHTLVEKSGPLPESRVIHILLQVCASLNEAHGVGMIHRDIKPENLIIYARGGDYDMVKVLDFGLAKVAHMERPSPGTTPELPAGTPQYLSPEAIQDPGTIDGRADLYSLAGVGYFLLTGKDAFEGKNPVEICRRQINDIPIPPSERLGRPVSKDLENVILKCLEKDRDHRPKDAATLMRELEACRDAGRWTVEDAMAWWEEVGDALVQEELLSGERPGVTESMMQVDLKRRRKA